MASAFLKNRLASITLAFPMGEIVAKANALPVKEVCNETAPSFFSYKSSSRPLAR